MKPEAAKGRRTIGLNARILILCGVPVVVAALFTAFVVGDAHGRLEEILRKQ
jgi:hypothetical protein